MCAQFTESQLGTRVIVCKKPFSPKSYIERGKLVLLNRNTDLFLNTISKTGSTSVLHPKDAVVEEEILVQGLRCKLNWLFFFFMEHYFYLKEH